MSAVRPHVLLVSPYLPWPPASGSMMRVWQLMRQLAVDHDVSLVSYGDPAQSRDGEDLRELRDLCRELVVVPWTEKGPTGRRWAQVRGLLGREAFHSAEMWSERMQATLDGFLATHRVDVVQVETSPMMCFRYPTDVPVVLNEHNIESELLQRMAEGEQTAARRAFNAREARRYRRHEERAWRAAQGVAVTSAREEQELLRRVPGVPTAVVPNGVDPTHFDGFRVPPDEQDGIAFNGILGYRPNVDAVRFFLTDVMPLVRRERPGAVFTVIGSGPPAELSALEALGARVTGYVDDVRPWLARAACVVVPIRMGSGTRLKVVEALSLGQGVVSTTVGCEGIDVVGGRHLLVADTPADLARDVVRLLDEPALRERLGGAGRQLVVERYSWERCSAPLADLYGRLAVGVP